MRFARGEILSSAFFSCWLVDCSVASFFRSAPSFLKLSRSALCSCCTVFWLVVTGPAACSTWKFVGRTQNLECFQNWLCLCALMFQSALQFGNISSHGVQLAQNHSHFTKPLVLLGSSRTCSQRFSSASASPTSNWALADGRSFVGAVGCSRGFQPLFLDFQQFQLFLAPRHFGVEPIFSDNQSSQSDPASRSTVSPRSLTDCQMPSCCTNKSRSTRSFWLNSN